MNRPHPLPAKKSRPASRRPGRVAAGCWLWASLALAAKTAPAQEALQNSLAGDAAIEAMRAQLASQPYTVKTGNLKLLVAPSFEMDWNDNVNLAQTSPQEDFILRPLLNLGANYPLTQGNWFQLNAGVGYDEYVRHTEYSGPRLLSGSALSFDFYVKDFHINLHDRSNYTQNDSGVAAIAGTGFYGGLDNSIGPEVTWDLRDVVLTLGYDHENFVASTSQFDYVNRASELLLARAGLRVHPRLTVGLEGTGSFTGYDERYLNDNWAYSFGGYADWRPSSSFKVQARAGYTTYLFEQTSLVIPALDQSTWYAGLTLSHAVSEAVTYSLSAGHELTLGIYADTITDTYVRPGVTWKIIKDITLIGNISYQDGQQGFSSQGGAFAEHFDWFTAGLGVSYSPMKRVTTTLSYHRTLRSSDHADLGYNQDLVGLLITYHLPYATN